MEIDVEQIKIRLLVGWVRLKDTLHLVLFWFLNPSLSSPSFSLSPSSPFPSVLSLLSSHSLFSSPCSLSLSLSF
jgi:hypothetical protein